MELTSIQISIAIAGGFLAGIINTLAGNGSAITLSILTEVIGLPGNLANGTNRVGILFQSIASTFSFAKNKKLDIGRSKFIIGVTIIGAIAGVITAVNVSNEAFKSVFKILIVLMLFVVLVNPKRWFIASDLEKKLPLYLSVPLFLALGFYGGFIQMGMGVFFLASMVLIAKYNIIEANAVKIAVVTIYTFLVVAIFHWKGLIDWRIGSIVAIGQASGGYLAAQFASHYPKADIWAYRLLVVIIIAVILKTFNLLPW
jgi:uncharacterized membrane protein YfcA